MQPAQYMQGKPGAGPACAACSMWAGPRAVGAALCIGGWSRSGLQTGTASLIWPRGMDEFDNPVLDYPDYSGIDYEHLMEALILMRA